jgi:hypothetical protein
MGQGGGLNDYFPQNPYQPQVQYGTSNYCDSQGH